MMDELRKEAIRKLEECCLNEDVEVAHHDADDVLCDLLTPLGYADVVGVWGLVDKWYA